VSERTFAGYCEIRQLDLDSCFETLEAQDDHLPRKVWLRALARGLSPDSVYGAALRHEAEALMALDDVSTPHCYQLVENDRALWLVLEAAEAQSLKKIRAENTSVPALALCTVMRKVAEALSRCHAQGIVHGSLRPNCVWTTATGVRLTDFTSASIDGKTAATTLDLVSDRDFCAPEQRVGKSATAATDLFSLGRVIQASMPMEAPRGFVEIVERCTERQPAERFPTADNLVAALETWQRSVDPEEGRARSQLSEFGLSPSLATLPVVEANTAGPPRSIWFGVGALAVFVAIVISALFVGTSNAELELAPTPRGYLRVLARPWAHVWIDGRLIETTPFAHAIELSPGEYSVRLEHPDVEKTVTVTIERDETEWLEVELVAPPQEPVPTMPVPTMPVPTMPVPTMPVPTMPVPTMPEATPSKTVDDVPNGTP
jgi:eukaryotic-like serine/threonine-protein kinase